MMFFRDSRCTPSPSPLPPSLIGMCKIFRHLPGPIAAAMMLAAMFVSPFASQQAEAHPYWPNKPKEAKVVLKQRGNDLYSLPDIYNLKVKYLIHTAPPAYNAWESNQAEETGVNWCKAKETLPAGWDTQDDRRLRTDSMCKSAPAYGGLGEIHLRDKPRTNVDHEWTSPELKGWQDGDYIISINYWTPSSHHAGGSHTGLFKMKINAPN